MNEIRYPANEEAYERLKKSKGIEFLYDLERATIDKFFTLQDIGKKYKISRERVRQLFEKVYGHSFTEYYKQKITKYREENPDYLLEANRRFRDKKKPDWVKAHQANRKAYRESKKGELLNKNDIYRELPLLFNSALVEKISWQEYTERSETGYLIVKCKYCGKKFIPKTKEVIQRSVALNSLGTDSNSLYCSSGCKQACPTFHQKKLFKGQQIDSSSREVQPELRQMCLNRDDYTCQKCGANGKTVQLHCHHIKAVADDPIESADLDNTITYCKACHKEVHQTPGCKYHELRCA